MSASTIELYWGSGSTPAWRALLGLHHKGLPYTSRLLSFSARETRSEAFLAINPRGKVPALVHGELRLNESLAILAYLDALQPAPPLFGQGAAEVGQVWRWCMEYESHGGPTFSNLARPLLFGAAPEPGALDVTVPAVVEELDRLSAAVAENGALVGGQRSAADIVWYCGLRFLERALSRPVAEAHAFGLWPLLDRWPGLARWAAMVESTPGFADTVPPHWLEGTAPLTVALR